MRTPRPRRGATRLVELHAALAAAQRGWQAKRAGCLLEGRSLEGALRGASAQEGHRLCMLFHLRPPLRPPLRPHRRSPPPHPTHPPPPRPHPLPTPPRPLCSTPQSAWCAAMCRRTLWSQSAIMSTAPSVCPAWLAWPGTARQVGGRAGGAAGRGAAWRAVAGRAAGGGESPRWVDRICFCPRVERNLLPLQLQPMA